MAHISKLFKRSDQQHGGQHRDAGSHCSQEDCRCQEDGCRQEDGRHQEGGRRQEAARSVVAPHPATQGWKCLIEQLVAQEAQAQKVHPAR